MDCIFCKIINGDIPCYKLFENENVLVFLDINPKSPGHMLVVPKKHTLDFDSISNDELMSVLGVAKDMAKLLTEKLNASGYTLIQNNGVAQDVKHFHLHIIPKYNKKVSLNIEEVHNILTK